MDGGDSVERLESLQSTGRDGGVTTVPATDFEVHSVYTSSSMEIGDLVTVQFRATEHNSKCLARKNRKRLQPFVESISFDCFN